MLVIDLMELDVVVLEKLNVRICCVLTVSRRLGELEQRWCCKKRERENMKSASMPVYNLYLESWRCTCIYIPPKISFDFKLSDIQLSELV
jgi:hypothetical protein